MSWLSGPKAPETDRPMFAHFAESPRPETPQNLDVAEKSPSATIEPPVAVTAAAPEPSAPPMPVPPQADQAEPPQSKEENVVSQETPKEPDKAPVQEDAQEPARQDAAPEAEHAPTPSSKVTRSGGRAERLRAEDAADQRAREQRYKNFDIGESSLDAASASAEQTTTAKKQSGGVGRVVGLFIVLVVMATAVIGTASWWVPRVADLARSVGPSEPAPQEPQQVAQPETTPDRAPEASVSQSPSSAPPAAPAQNAASLQARIAALEERLANTASSNSLGQLEDRMNALEQGGVSDESVTSMGQSLSSQARQLAAVSARLSTLEAAIGNAARLEDLADRISVLEGKSADAASVLSLSDRVTGLEETSRSAVARQTAEVALLMATVQLREAIAAGRSFAAELETANALSERVLGSAIDAGGFATYSPRGIPTLSDLQRRFDSAAASAVRAGTIPDGASGWIRQSLDRLLSIVTVRRADGEIAGESTSAVLARAENRLNNGELAAATVELNALNGAAADAIAAWTADARARIAAENAASGVTNRVLAAMTAEGRAQTTPDGDE